MLFRSDGGFLFNEVGKFQFKVGGLGIELVLQGAEDFRDALYVDEATVILQDLKKPAHMRALELMGQIDRQGHGGDGVLGRTGAIPDHDRVTEVLHTHFVDPEVAKIRRRLRVVKLSRLGTGFFHGT